MPKMNGINVVGYGVEEKGMQTCGQFEIGGFTGWLSGMTPENFIRWSLMPLSYGTACNLVFSITGNHFIPSAATTGLLAWLLNSPKTRVMHWYKNDAHGPNWIFLCIYHHQMPKKGCSSPGYSVDEIKSRITYTQGVYGMKPSL